MNAQDVLHYGHLTVHGTLGTVPLAEWERSGVCGVWSVKNIVAHLASYERLLEEILGSLTGPRATPLLDSYLEIGPELFNDLEVDKRRTLDPAATLANYDAAHDAVMALLPHLSPEHLSQPGTLPWYGTAYALDDLLVYQYYGHKREHMAQVAALAEQLGQEGSVRHFNEALNRRDIDGMMEMLTPTSHFENTSPAPDGTRYEGKEAVRAFWDGFFEEAATTEIEVEELFGSGDRCVMRWRYRWVDRANQPGHVRGIDLYTLRNGQIAEKLSYVKG